MSTTLEVVQQAYAFAKRADHRKLRELVADDATWSPAREGQWNPCRDGDMVVQTMGQANADKVLETFIAPGVGHCVGGVGPDTVDLMKALATWVEGGSAPSAQGLNLSKLDPATKAVTMTRPLCKHPSYPRYTGSGDPNSASSFVCSTQ